MGVRAADTLCWIQCLSYPQKPFSLLYSLKKMNRKVSFTLNSFLNPLISEDDLILQYHTFPIDPSPSIFGTSLQRVKFQPILQCRSNFLKPTESTFESDNYVSVCKVIFPCFPDKLPNYLIFVFTHFWTSPLKVIWTYWSKGQKSLKRIAICLISTWKHIMYAYSYMELIHLKCA